MEQPSTSPLPLDRAPQKIAGMFDGIAPRYDLLNHLLSAGLDRRWRARAVAALDLSGRETVLDLCTGTADLALALCEGERGARRVVGVDFAAEMLRQGQHKLARRPQHRPIQLLRGDAIRLPFAPASMDAVTIGFGIRNVCDPPEALAEIMQVLRPGGRLAILEFGEPQREPFRSAYLLYFRRLLPLIGQLVSRHGSAYSYLPASVGEFYSPPDFSHLLQTVGLTAIRVVSLTGGIVYLYTGQKPGSQPTERKGHAQVS